MLKRVATALWGNFENTDELKKFGFLGAIFFLIIGIYWALRPMKDSIFDAIVGLGAWQPTAKLVSLAVVFPLVILYGKLIDTFPRHRVFYGLITFYAIAALLFAWFFADPTYGLLNPMKGPDRILGWLWYVYVESFGSLIVALFWAFTADTTSPESAKRGFPIIALLGQMGNIFGPFILDAQRLGFTTSAPIVGVCGGLMLVTGLVFWLFMRVIPKYLLVGYHQEGETKESEPGFLEGLKLLVSQGYLLAIFLIVTIYEIIITIVDFHFKATASQIYGASQAGFSNYLSNYAVMTGIVATVCVLLGINNIQRKLGMTASLVLLPILVTVAVITIKLNPTALTVAFWIMVFSKAVNYALNQPTMKQLYIPTTKDARYKSQAWIEMFGSRGSKGAGSIINNFRKTFVSKYGSVAGVAWFLTFSSLMSLGLIGVWLFVAIYAAKTYNKAIAENKVVC